MRERRRFVTLWGVIGALCLGSTLLAGMVAETDGPGNIRKLNLAGTRLAFKTDVWMPAQGWGATARTGDAWHVGNVTAFESEGRQVWTGRASAPGGPAFDYRQALYEENGKVHWSVRVTSRTNAPVEGVFLFLSVPVSVFSRGTFQFLNGSTVSSSLLLPETYPGQPHLRGSGATAVELTDPDRRFRVGVEFDRSRVVTIQDNREWGEPWYAFYFAFHSGNLAAGAEVSTSITIDAEGQTAIDPVDVTLAPESSGEYFDGWGGNFVFCHTGPEVDTLLSNLRVAWARSGMSLRDWEPQNDNASADSMNWSYFNARVAPGSPLDKEFRAAQDLEQRGIPHIISVWWLPTWLQPTEGTALPAAKWGELREMVGSYLLYAKEHYGVEPDYFSFNEPDEGVYVLFSEREHAAALRSFGAYFESIGLKTRLLLGDVANASNPGYVGPGGADREALQYAGAVAFHSWNGSTPDLLGQWRATARALNRPLLVTEVGSDASAWHFPDLFRTYGYALDDLENYLQFLVHARPRGAMQWELTCDYPLVEFQGGQLRTTPRYYFVKQLANLTPEPGEYLDVSTSDLRVWAVAFQGPATRKVAAATENAAPMPADAEGKVIVLHLANLGPSRRAKVSGWPSEAVSVRGVETSESGEYVDAGPFPVVGGSVELSLKEQSLMTLTAALGPADTTYFAHFAKGKALLASRVTLLNPSAGQTVTGRLELTDDLGRPATVEFGGRVASGETGFSLPPGGGVNLETSAAGALVTGSARVRADGKVAGTILFGGPVGWAGVGSSAMMTEGFVAPVERSVLRGINTGIAVEAVGIEAVQLELELRGADGAWLSQASEALPPQGHRAKFVDEFNWSGSGPAEEFSGTLVVRSSRPVAATVLQTRPGELVTLPVTPLPAVAATEAARLGASPLAEAGPLYFPHFASAGDQLVSELILVNPDPAATAEGSIRLTTAAGEPMAMTLNGSETAGELAFSIPPLGLGVWKASSPQPKVGSVRVTSVFRLGGSVLFAGPVGAAGVGSSVAVGTGLLIPVDRSLVEKRNTGLAVTNLSSGEVRLNLALIDLTGKVLSHAVERIPGQGQRARFITESAWVPAIDLTEFSGLLRVCSTHEIAAVALLSRPGQFATLPVTAAEAGTCLEAAGAQSPASASVRPGTTWTSPPAE